MEKIKYVFDKYMYNIRLFYYDKRERDDRFSYLRVNSIDVLRGLMVVFAIFLICQGIKDSINPIFEVSKWNGLSLADILLPFFILIMGMSVPFYVKKYYDDGYSLGKIIFKSIIKFAVLLVLGILFSILFIRESNIVRLTGPIQLIAINYLIILSTYILFIRLRIKNNALVHVFLVIGLIWSLIFTIVGMSSGNDVAKSIFTTVDMSIISDFKNSAISDSEGILSIASSISLGYIGLMFGCIINKKNIEKRYIHYRRPYRVKTSGYSRDNVIVDIKSWFNPKSIKAIFSNYYRFNNEVKKIIHLFSIFLLFVVLMLISSIWVPMNRYLFSISFVLMVGAVFALIELLLYILCDIVNIKFGVTFLQKIGYNALAIVFLVNSVYTLANLIKIKSLFTQTWLPFSNWFTTDFILPVFGIEYASSVYSIFATVLWLLLFNILSKFDLKTNV